eukprot:5054284-Pleurochrysis_carterae.AAC.3
MKRLVLIKATTQSPRETLSPAEASYSHLALGQKERLRLYQNPITPRGLSPPPLSSRHVHMPYEEWVIQDFTLGRKACSLRTEKVDLATSAETQQS